jgi:hypothetical protein
VPVVEQREPGGRIAGTSAAPGAGRRLVYLCDWLPPDFGAVGQYSLQFARERAAGGELVTLFGLSSGDPSTATETVGEGHLTVVRVPAVPYDRGNFRRRMWWTMAVNTRLVRRAFKAMRAADEILFTGSPPFLLHWLMPLRRLFRARMVYRITDFHPECLIAELNRTPFPVAVIQRLTWFWRRRVDRFEVLGEDQRRRLETDGIRLDRIVLKRDRSPVEIGPGTRPLPRPPGTGGRVLLLYSGNWGVAHDWRTVVEGYERHHRSGSARVLLWINAIGRRTQETVDELERRSLPYVRSDPVSVDDLAGLLVTPDAHLITLRDAFVGYVLPSKVYGCIESGLPVVYIGSASSDVHLLCSERLKPETYRRIDVGDATATADVLEWLASLHGAGARPWGESGKSGEPATAAFHRHLSGGLQ